MPAAGNVVGAWGSAPPRRSLPANGPSFLRRGPEVRWGGVGARPARGDATPAHQVELAGRDLGHAVRPAEAAGAASADGAHLAVIPLRVGFQERPQLLIPAVLLRG